jgi:hypothetical protein
MTALTFNLAFKESARRAIAMQLNRRSKFLKIQTENQQLLKRIREKPPTLNTLKLENDFRVSE